MGHHHYHHRRYHHRHLAALPHNAPTVEGISLILSVAANFCFCLGAYVYTVISVRLSLPDSPPKTITYVVLEQYFTDCIPKQATANLPLFLYS